MPAPGQDPAELEGSTKWAAGYGRRRVPAGGGSQNVVVIKGGRRAACKAQEAESKIVPQPARFPRFPRRADLRKHT